MSGMHAVDSLTNDDPDDDGSQHGTGLPSALVFILVLLFLVGIAAAFGNN